MIERTRKGNFIEVKYKCDTCEKGFLNHCDFEKDFMLRYKHKCSNCGKIFWKLTAFPYMEV